MKLPIFLALLTLPTVSPRAAETETASAPIPFSEIGAKASADYQGDALGINVTPVGAELHTGFQKLSGTVTNEGLRLNSTADEGGSLRLVASGIGRGAEFVALPMTG